MTSTVQIILAIALIISGLSTAGISFATTLTRTTTNAALTAQAKTFVPQKHQGLLLLAGGGYIPYSLFPIPHSSETALYIGFEIVVFAQLMQQHLLNSYS